MATKSDLRLEASITAQTPQGITISYAVHNLRSTIVYVCDLLFHTTPRGDRTFDPQLAYAFPDANGRLTVGKLLLPVPEGKKAEAPEIPLWRAVAPSQQKSGTIYIALPVQPFHPYRAARQQGQPLPSTGCDLQIGVLDPTRAKLYEALLSPYQGPDPDLYICDYGLGLEYQETLSKDLRVRFPYFPLP